MHQFSSYCSGYGNEIFDEGSADQMESRIGGRDTPGLAFFAVYFAWLLVVCWWFYCGFWVFATRRWLACFPRVFGVFGLVGFALVAGLV